MFFATLQNGWENQLHYIWKNDSNLRGIKIIPHLIIRTLCLIKRGRECTALITEAKKRYVTKMSVKLDNPESVPKTC